MQKFASHMRLHLSPHLWTELSTLLVSWALHQEQLELLKVNPAACILVHFCNELLHVQSELKLLSAIMQEQTKNKDVQGQPTPAVEHT